MTIGDWACLLSILTCFVSCLYTIAGMARRTGYSEGLAEGVKSASEWRDKAIADYDKMLREALCQRDDLLAKRVDHNPFTTKPKDAD